jgi:Tol biopolymer transport system component
MKPHQFIVMVLILAFVGFSSGFAQQSAEQLYQSGLYQEEIEGDLEAAIKIYETIISSYVDNRPVAAKTYLHIGLCYEKLGLNEAQKAYRNVVENYPEQTAEVALARKNLNRLLAAVDVHHKPTFRKINIPTELPWTVKLSPDGKTLSLVSDKKLWALPLEGNLGSGFSGTPVQINTDGTEVEWSGLFWSYDGKWIAFNEFPETTDSVVNQWICIVSSNGGKPKKVAKPYRDYRIVNYQIGISPDAEKLVFSSVKDDKQYIYSIPVEGGNPMKLTDMEAREPVFSPDGKMIAFAADRGIGRGEGDLGLWVVPSGGGTPRLVADAIKATSPVWSPDCSMIAYIDEGQPRMYIARIDKTGQIIGNPFSFDAPEGTSFIKILAGWTPDKKIGALLMTEQESAIYTLPVQGGQAAMIQRNTDTYSSQPRWSTDGKRIYYTVPPEGVNLKGLPNDMTILAAVPATGGSGNPVSGDLSNKEIRLFRFGGGNRVSPDGKTMVAGAWTPEDVSSEYHYPMARIWKLALDGTVSTQITKTIGPFLDSYPCWSPDGTKIAFIRHKLIKGKTNDSMGEENVYIIDSSGGEPELVDSVPAVKNIFSLTWSPDGKKLACFTRKKDINHIYIFDIENGTAAEVGEVQNGIYSGHCELAWSPDSKRIAFNYNDDERSGIRVMTLSDGSIEEINTGLSDIDKIVHFDWSPDGERFVFSGWKHGKKEFWLLENFLPELE